MYPLEFLQNIGHCAHDISLSHGLYVSMLIAGFVGGFMHCTVMCGPFVMAQSGTVEKLKNAALLPYHLGRITTYTMMAIALSTVLNAAFLFLPIRSYVVAPILMIAGLIFLVTAFPALAKIFPWAARVQIAMPYRWLQSGFEKLSTNKTLLGRYGIGVLLGFMPCGMIVSALMAASTAPSPLHAGAAMSLFGMGTMPALISVALGGGLLSRKHPHIMKHVTKGMMVCSALWLFAIAGFILI